ncbi:unnamed protein product [Rhizoctonia solani]|uniref:Nephrocystin 3-like N-terminal domain-containing protein n=1 Tax=Rhizoctonia solani TaxID=456999 RepID=A0A8H2XK38_9AGAM|nr:unnamed protein product [Rhizoctonia solani]
MPICRKLKQAREYVRNVFSSTGAARPSTPISTNLLSNSPQGGAQELGTLGARDSTISLSAQVPRRPPSGLPSPPAQSPQVVPEETSIGWKGLKEFARIMRPATDVLGPIKDMAELLVQCVDMYEMAVEAQREYEALQTRLEAIFEDLNKHFGEGCSPTMTSSIESLCRSIKLELEYIRSKQGRRVGTRFLLAPGEEDVILGCYRRIEGYLQRLSLNANLSTWKIVEEQAADSRSDRMSFLVDRLPSSLSACYNSAQGVVLKRGGCTPDTRVDVLTRILDWTRDSNEEAVFWLNGMAGTGKTTIAYSVCDKLNTDHKLAASFFCSRLREECRNVNLIAPSIAYQLARFSRPFQSVLSAVLEKDPDVHTKSLNIQFEELIAKPLRAVKRALPEGLVVAIDALDECEHKNITGDLLDILLTEATSLPIKFIVSSRPEPEIRDRMTDELAKFLVLHELDKGEIQVDIEKYLRKELAPMKPTQTQIAALVERAGILFIYAATAVRYIGHDNFKRDPSARLSAILKESDTRSTTKNNGIDQLYTTILEAALGDQEVEETERDDMKLVLYTVICAREHLTVKDLSELLQINNVGRIHIALRPLWSVLHIVGGRELVTTLHASFADFMFDLDRSKTYHCDSYTHNQLLANRCFELITRTQPQFNICGLESSYLGDESVSNIEDQVAKAISPELLYACRFWADHVEAGKCASVLVGPLRDFLSTRLLLWMEILNLNKQMKAGMECMKIMVGWCDKFEAYRELMELAHDAERFAGAFASNPISQSTPHIYLSMLAFWPETSPIAKHYAKYVHESVKAEGTALERRQLAHLARWAFDKGIEAMAISPDGLSVALGIGSDMHVVDSSSGERVLGPLKGHENLIKSIAFSPDGTLILAGSTHYKPYYATILGWDTRTGEIKFGPLQLDGHTDVIQRLSFSPDCTCIATGSSDKSLRLWDAENGAMLHRLGTQGTVWAMAFSPDGTRIVAGFGNFLQIWDKETGNTTLGSITAPISVDKLSFFPGKDQIVYASDEPGSGSICVLDARSGEKTLGPIGHTDGTTCIGSPDHGYIVSGGSEDRTVCVWDAENGNLVLGPLEAHTGEITSVAFSHGGTRIISACRGGLVCTWDARQRNLTSGSSNAPFDPITCVKFSSSDGTQFVSGSEVGTICTWDTRTGRMQAGPIKTHASPIHAIDFLNNRVISGSEDGNLCVYDALTGGAVLGPLKVLPTREVQAVAYSPDGKHIATGSDDGIDLWDAQKGSRVLDPFIGLQGSVVSIQFSPSGTRIVDR